MDDSENSAGAVLRRYRETKGLSRQKLADAVGAHHNQIQKLENNERELTLDWLKKIAPHLGVGVGQILADMPGIGDESTPYRERPGPVALAGQDFIPIGRFDASFSMGPGSLIPNDPEPLGYWIFEEQWLRALNAAAPDYLAVVKVDGDSMMPTLSGGDLVLIDRSKNRPNREGIYAIRVGDTAWVKRISLNLRNKKVRVLSDNPLFEKQPEMDEEDLSIIGRVIALVARKVA